MFKIEITDGVNRQVKKLKSNITKAQAEELLERLYNADYLEILLDHDHLFNSIYIF